jgi:hypothetical protein
VDRGPVERYDFATMRGSIIACALLLAGSVSADPTTDKKADDTAKDKKDKKDKKDNKKKDKKDNKKKDKKDEPEIEMEGEATAPTPTPPPTTTTTTTVTVDPATTSVSATPAPPPPGGFPLQIDDRPLTLPKSKLDFHAGFPILVYSVPNMAGTGNTTDTVAGFAIGAAYGVDDKIEIGGDYALSLSPGDVKGPLTFHVAYRFTHDPKLEVAFAGALALDFVETTPTTTTTYFGLQFAAWVRYHIVPKVSLFTGSPGLPSTPLALDHFSLALPPIGYQLQLGLVNGAAIAIEVPVGVGFQATPNIYTFAAINIANIKIRDTVNAFLFADFIPLSLGGFYSMDKIDIGAIFADDLKNAGDHLAFSVAARYFMK